VQGREAMSRKSIKRRVSVTKDHLWSRASLRLVVAVGGHTWLRRYAGAVSLISLHVALVSQSLLGIHGHVGHIVVGRHVRVLGHTRSAALGRKVLVWGLFGRLDLVAAVNTVLVAWGGLGCIKACLNQVLAFRLGHKRLKLRCGKGIDETSFGHDKK
jgi:hypothetical protein